MKTKLFALFIYLLISSTAQAMTITEIQPLSFGSIVPDINGGTIQRYQSMSNISGTATFSGTSQEASISVEHSLATTTGFFTVFTGNLTGPGGNLTVTSFQPSSSWAEPVGATPTLYDIGAQITYPADITAGTYTGTFSVEISYDLKGTLRNLIEYINVSIQILPIPISINQTTPMNFGQIIADPAGGEIHLTLVDTVTNTSGTSTLGGFPTSGKITITGAPNTQVFISPISNIILDGPGASVVTVSSIESKFLTATLDANGSELLTIYADLTFPANVEAGAYTGTYNITINY